MSYLFIGNETANCSFLSSLVKKLGLTLTLN